MSELSPEGAAGGLSEAFLASVANKIALRRREAHSMADATPQFQAAAKPQAGASMEAETTEYERAACVLAWFDADTIRPLSGKPDPRLVELLLTASTMTLDADGRRRCMLSTKRRVAALRELRIAKRVEIALAANPRPQDPVQSALDSYLQGPAKPIEEQTLIELTATHQVHGWLRAAGFANLPDAVSIALRAEWLSLLQPFEHIAADQHFRGRSKELSALREYVGVMPPTSTLSLVKRKFQAIFSLDEKPPLLVVGPGGVGKSTLLARFILEHARAHRTQRFPIAYLDFDRAEVDAGEPLTLLVEAMRQIAIEYPEARSQCESLSTKWLEDFGKSRADRQSQSASIQATDASSAVVEGAVRDFASLVTTLGASDLPVLFVLDTFEEVQWRSAGHVAAVWRLLESLQAVLTRFRVVIAGRADIDGRQTKTLALTGLDDEAAVAYLREHGATDEDTARRIVRQIGGSPLSLKLAAELVRRAGANASGELDIASRSFLFFEMDSTRIQRQLYKRILGHIHNPVVRKLAHPGLVLRRVTPELIQQVLAEPCGVVISSIEEAQSLFAELTREVSLVRAMPDGSVRHRQDLRLVMLELLRADEPAKVAAIHQSAIGYYEKRPPEPAERAEEIYHRLSVESDLGTVSARWLPGVDPHLASALEEFKGRVRAYLASRLNVEVDDATRQLADQQDWEVLTRRRVSDLLDHNQNVAALELLRSRPDRSPASPLVALEARAQTLLGRFEEALDTLERGFALAASAGERECGLSLAKQSADVVFSGRIDAKAESAFDRLVSLAQEFGSAANQVELLSRCVLLTGLNRKLSDKVPDLAARLGAAFDALPDATLGQTPTLGYWAAAAFGPPDVPRLARVIRLCGLPRTSDTSLRQLGAVLASFDAQESALAGKSPGMLARELEIPPANSLTAAWSDFLIRGSPTLVRRNIAQLLVERAAQLPSAVTTASANVMLAGLGLRLPDPPAGAPPRAPPNAPAIAPRAQAAEIDGRMMQRICAAIEQEFTPQMLNELLRYRLGRNIEALSLALNAKQLVLEVVQRAMREGWIADLVSGLVASRPDSIGLGRIAQELGIRGHAASGIDLQAVAREGNFQDVQAFTSRLNDVLGRVCLVQLDEATRGVGFLVGADLLLTANHVLLDVFDGKAAASAVTLSFDQDDSVTRANRSSQFRLADDWLVARSHRHYALLRIADSPGAQPIGGTRAESSARLRRWFELTDRHRAPLPDETVIALQSDEGRLQLALGRTTTVTPDGRYFSHDCHLRPGSSGGPCFSSSLELMGMQLGSALSYASTQISSSSAGSKFSENLAVSVAAIFMDLDRQGFGSAALAPFA